MLNYKCERCGTPLGFEGLCWKCRCEMERESVLAWTPEEKQEKIRNMIEHAENLEEYGEQENKDFWGLLCCHGMLPPDVARAALKAGVWYPPELYYGAPADVRDGLIQALLAEDLEGSANNLLCCLSMQGDEKAREVLMELEENPRPWRKRLYVDPSVYAQCGGWTFDKEGTRRQLNYDVCYTMEKGDRSGDSAAVIGRIREDVCPYCGCSMVDMLVLDGRDPRLSFLGIHGIITATCCPNCVCYEEAAYSRFTLDGGSQPVPLEEGTEEDYTSSELEGLRSNTFILGKSPVPVFYGSQWDDVNTIGGFANWVQDWHYTICPDCGAAMHYVAQIQWDTLMDGMEGTLYIEICPDCHVASMHHQQT